MRQFVIRQNIERYTELLKRCDLEEPRRRMLERLLEEEQSKLAAAEDKGEDEPPQDSADRVAPE